MLAIRSFFFVYAWLLSVGCSKSPDRNPAPPWSPPAVNPPAPPPATTNLKMLSLGDSYTIGQSVSEQDRFPVQTRALLVSNGKNFQMPEIIAVTGWTTQRLQEAIRTQNPTGPYDVVTLLIGVNDQYQRLSIDGYRTRFEQLLAESIRLAGNRPRRVFVLSIPDYSVTPFAQNMDRNRIRQEIDAFNTVNRDISSSRGVHYLDITPSTREAANDPTLVASDGLHPSGREYARWSARLAPLILTELP